MNLIEELGLEKCKAIVDGAPEWGTHYDLTNRDYYDVEDDELFLLDFSICLSLKDLRAAIADYDRTDYVSDIRNHIAPTTVVIER